MERIVDIRNYQTGVQTIGALAVQTENTQMAPVVNKFFEGPTRDGKVVSITKFLKPAPQKRETSSVINHHRFNMGEVALDGEASEQKAQARRKLTEQPEATLSPEELVRLNSSFIQMRISIGGVDQALNVSNGLFGGIETIQPVMESLVGQARGSDRWKEFKNADGVVDQMAAYIDINIEDFDLHRTLSHFFRAPSQIYGAQGLDAQVQVQEQREASMFAENGKANLATDILSSRVNRLVQAYDPKEGDFWGNSIYVWNSQKQGSEMEAADMKGNGQTETELAMDSRVSVGMRNSILDRQQMSAETPLGVVRIYFSADAGGTIYCCDNATNSMLDKTTITKSITSISEIEGTVISSSSTRISDSSENMSFPTNHLALGGAAVQETDICNTCSETKNSEGKCNCSK